MDLFRIGSQCGLKPGEVLDMSLDMFKTYIQGYSDRLFDLQILSIQSGYWAAYYSNAKHPKPLKVLIAEMIRKRNKTEKKSKNVIKPEVDVNAFLAQEERFLKRLQSK